jgi:hypothetical protein
MFFRESPNPRWRASVTTLIDRAGVAVFSERDFRLKVVEVNIPEFDSFITLDPFAYG